MVGESRKSDGPTSCYVSQILRDNGHKTFLKKKNEDSWNEETLEFPHIKSQRQIVSVLLITKIGT